LLNAARKVSFDPDRRSGAEQSINLFLKPHPVVHNPGLALRMIFGKIA
jgi:hypothetical protein